MRSFDFSSDITDYFLRNCALVAALNRVHKSRVRGFRWSSARCLCRRHIEYRSNVREKPSLSRWCTLRSPSSTWTICHAMAKSTRFESSRIVSRKPFQRRRVCFYCSRGAPFSVLSFRSFLLCYEIVQGFLQFHAQVHAYGFRLPLVK